MKIALIDLGTNSVRFDVHRLNAKNSTLILSEKLMVRLGEDVFTTGRLQNEAMQRTLQAFYHFQQVAQDLGAQKIFAVATSALREAKDSKKLISLIHKKTGIRIKIISGSEEARLIAQGVLSKEKVPKGNFAIVDIGGGSLEVIICNKNKILKHKSFPLGAARIQQLFLRRSPPSRNNVEKLRAHIQTVLNTTFEKEDWPHVNTVIGSSGTIRALAKIMRRVRGQKKITTKETSKLVDRLAMMTPTQLLQVPGMEPKRVDIILSGAIAFEECLKLLKAKTFITTNYSLRYGLLEQERKKLAPKSSDESSRWINIESIYKKAIHFGLPVSRAKSLYHNVEILFRGMKKLHHLDPIWQECLLAASVCRNMGKAISAFDSEYHSFYIIKNLDASYMQTKAAEWVADLCLFHNDNKIDKFKLPYEKEQERHRIFIQLLCMLQLIDALDCDQTGRSRLQRITVGKHRVTLHVPRAKNPDLCSLRLGKKTEFFAKVFRKELEVKFS